jgi:hypothetical protein
MLLCNGQFTWQNGTPHCEQREACVSADSGLKSLYISSKSATLLSADRFAGMAFLVATNCNIFDGILRLLAAGCVLPSA